MVINRLDRWLLIGWLAFWFALALFAAAVVVI